MQRITETPWGRPEQVTMIADGIAFVSTPSHGGFVLSEERNAAIPSAARDQTFAGQGARGFYEEDCDAWIVIASHPSAFPAEDVERAHKMLAGMDEIFGKDLARHFQ